MLTGNYLTARGPVFTHTWTRDVGITRFWPKIIERLRRSIIFGFDSWAVPLHWDPPFSGEGFVHVRYRVIFPVPHDAEQLCQAPHSLQLPSTTSNGQTEKDISALKTLWGSGGFCVFNFLFFAFTHTPLASLSLSSLFPTQYWNNMFLINKSVCYASILILTSGCILLAMPFPLIAILFWIVCVNKRIWK